MIFGLRPEEEKEPAMQRAWGKHCRQREQLMQAGAWGVRMAEGRPKGLDRRNMREGGVSEK